MLAPPKADKCEWLHYLKMSFSGQTPYPGDRGTPAWNTFKSPMGPHRPTPTLLSTSAAGGRPEMAICRRRGSLHHGRAAGLHDGSDIRAIRGRTARAVAGTHCVVLGLAPLHLQLFDASARLTLEPSLCHCDLRPGQRVPEYEGEPSSELKRHNRRDCHEI
jgi:hypothetical protein